MIMLPSRAKISRERDDGRNSHHGDDARSFAAVSVNLFSRCSRRFAGQEPTHKKRVNNKTRVEHLIAFDTTSSVCSRAKGGRVRQVPRRQSNNIDPAKSVKMMRPFADAPTTHRAANLTCLTSHTKRRSRSQRAVTAPTNLPARSVLANCERSQRCVTLYYFY